MHFRIKFPLVNDFPSYVGCNQSALVQKSLCYTEAVTFPIRIIHDTSCLRNPLASRPRKERLELYHRWIMGSPG